MKSFVRWSATVSLLGSVLLGSLFVGSARVLALTEQQVVERLRSVPVFALAGPDGTPLVGAPAASEGQNAQNRPLIANVFISQQDAQTFLNNLRQSGSDIPEDVRVVPLSLAQVYQLQVANRNNQQTQIAFAFIPMENQVEAARAILQQDGENAQQFEGVPIFTAQSSSDEGTYLTVRQGEQEVIPIYFERDALQAVIDRLRQARPELASDLTIEVTNLESLIDQLQSSDNEALNQILLIPPRSSIEFIQSLQGQQGQNGQRPQQAPAAGQNQQRPQQQQQRPQQQQQRQQ